MRVIAKDNDPDLALAMVDEILTIAPSIIIRTVKAGSVEVVSFPRLNPEPVSPRTVRNTAISALGGIFISAAFIIIRDLTDNTIKTDEDIRKKLGLPVLGVIPKIRESDLVPEKAADKSKMEGKKAGRYE